MEGFFFPSEMESLTEQQRNQQYLDTLYQELTSFAVSATRHVCVYNLVHAHAFIGNITL
jgi:hypothetical protein